MATRLESTIKVIVDDKGIVRGTVDLDYRAEGNHKSALEVQLANTLRIHGWRMVEAGNVPKRTTDQLVREFKEVSA